jgi:hypothetical protein
MPLLVTGLRLQKAPGLREELTNAQRRAHRILSGAELGEESYLQGRLRVEANLQRVGNPEWPVVACAGQNTVRTG